MFIYVTHPECWATPPYIIEIGWWFPSHLSLASFPKQINYPHDLILTKTFSPFPHTQLSLALTPIYLHLETVLCQWWNERPYFQSSHWRDIRETCVYEHMRQTFRTEMSDWCQHSHIQVYRPIKIPRIESINMVYSRPLGARETRQKNHINTFFFDTESTEQSSMLTKGSVRLRSISHLRQSSTSSLWERRCIIVLLQE